MATEDCYPVVLKRIDAATIQMEWSDEQSQTLTAAQLRNGCPCATCREKRSAPPPDPLQLQVITAEEAKPLTIDGMRPVGRYAYQVTFSDGHDTGIFTFEFLRSLGE